MVYEPFRTLLAHGMYVLQNVVLGDHLPKYTSHSCSQQDAQLDIARLIMFMACGLSHETLPIPFPERLKKTFGQWQNIICKPESQEILWKDSPILIHPKVGWSELFGQYKLPIRLAESHPLRLSSSPRQLHDVPTHLPRWSRNDGIRGFGVTFPNPKQILPFPTIMALHPDWNS